MVENDRLLVKVDWDENPGHEKGNKTSERRKWVLTILFAGFDHVQYATRSHNKYFSEANNDSDDNYNIKELFLPLRRVKDQNRSSVYHVPLVKRQFINIIRNEPMFGYTDCL